jgi:pimeloyl-ACP methyl ester carboxylesterase
MPRYSSPSSEQIAVDGLALSVLRWPGDEQPFLFVHGLASNARTWKQVAEHLASAGHDVTSVDLRGHGHSDKPDHGYDVSTVAEDVHALVVALGLDRPVVAGQSWGGNVVLEYAWRYGDEPAGVACVDGGTIRLRERWPDFSDCWRDLAPPALAGLAAGELEAAIRAAHPDWSDAGVEDTLANMETLPDGTVRPWLSRDRHRAVLRGLWEHDPASRYGQLRVPVLLLACRGGPAAWTEDKEREVARAAAAIPRARVVWFADADHDVHVQRPSDVGAALRGALADGFFQA